MGVTLFTGIMDVDQESAVQGLRLIDPFVGTMTVGHDPRHVLTGQRELGNRKSVTIRGNVVLECQRARKWTDFVAVYSITNGVLQYIVDFTPRGVALVSPALSPAFSSSVSGVNWEHAKADLGSEAAATLGLYIGCALRTLRAGLGDAISPTELVAYPPAAQPQTEFTQEGGKGVATCNVIVDERPDLKELVVSSELLRSVKTVSRHIENVEIRLCRVETDSTKSVRVQAKVVFTLVSDLDELDFSVRFGKGRKRAASDAPEPPAKRLRV